MAAVYKLLGEVDDPLDVLGGARLDVRAQDVQRVEILVHLGDELLSQGLGAHPALVGAADDLVVDVGDVADVGHVVAAVAQVPDDDVEVDERARMPDVAQVVHGHSAYVHPDLSLVDRLEDLFGLG